MQAKEMKECGVYALPDGREFVAHRGDGGQGFFRLYDPLAWKYEGPPMYETNERGVLTSVGRPTPWRVEDLKEVGQTVAPRRH
jgi:hypothetical protein